MSILLNAWRLLAPLVVCPGMTVEQVEFVLQETPAVIAGESKTGAGNSNWYLSAGLVVFYHSNGQVYDVAKLDMR